MASVNWIESEELVDYQSALSFMEQRAADIYENKEAQTIWLLEHPDIYTIGTSGNENEIIDAAGIEIIKTGRGGKITYHGPKQRIIYLMLDLREHGRDVRAFVQKVENWVILALAKLGIKGAIRDGRVGVWVDNILENGQIREEKIAAIGIRIRRYISFHGISINFDPDLTKFDGIIPCGISKHDYGVTSIKKIKPATKMADLDNALKETFETAFKIP